MKALITTLIEKANLSDEQATRVADVIKEFVADKVPAALQGTVTGALTGDNVDNALDQAKGMLGKLL